MIKTVIKIEGMACGMCEAHINDVIRKVCPDAKKVTSSFKKGESSFVSASPVDIDQLKQAIDATGYRFLSAHSDVYQKKGLFGLRK